MGILTEKQITDIEATAIDFQNKLMMLDTAVDVQVILQLLVQKGIVTREEVAEMREKVRNSSKYKASRDYLVQATEELTLYAKDPQARLKAMFDAKLNGKQ